MSHCFSLVVPRFHIVIWSHVCIYNLEVSWKLSRRWEGGAKGWWGAWGRLCSTGQHKYARKHVVNPKSISVGRSSSFCNWDRRDTGGLSSSFWRSPRGYQPPSVQLLSSGSLLFAVFIYIERKVSENVSLSVEIVWVHNTKLQKGTLYRHLSLLEFLRVLPDTWPLWLERSQGQLAVAFPYKVWPLAKFLQPP